MAFGCLNDVVLEHLTKDVKKQAGRLEESGSHASRPSSNVGSVNERMSEEGHK